jgi:hypothetical protein
MPGNPKQCRLNSARCLKLAEHARKPEVRQTFAALAETWKELAAELESDQALLQVIAELEFSQQPCEPHETLPLALRLGSWAAWHGIHNERALSELYSKQSRAA